MFSKEELRERKTLFWEGLKKKMQNRKSANGKRANWINYRTGLKFFYVRLDVNSKRAIFALDLQPKDEGIKEIFWEQLQELKVVLESEMGPGIWDEDVEIKYGHSVSRIYWELPDVNMFKKEDTDKIYAFFQEKLIAFDRFYTDYDEILLTLAQ
ncbi:DUF4268 domain-containing protein [Lishizhenia sp.]|uniref:DUF4268 domain-containing protein n=1 Tax=Lishizhenia sp. TaxID=2497594 RepID=UPI00299E0430|nr:DUF4268 domain-containing protein [Lishizhenia sp.]MDX1445733.1 DUF4268 domain-containing protein [Lishizhenia sp.]